MATKAELDNVPTQVRERFEAAQKAVTAQETGDAGNVTPEPAPDTGHPESGPTPVVEPAQGSETTPTEPSPTPEQGVEPAQPPEEPVGDEDNFEAQNVRLKSALDTLQGKYNKELPRKTAKVKELEEKLKRAEEQFAAVETRLVERLLQSTSASAPTTIAKDQLLTDDALRDQYGLTNEQIESAPLELFESISQMIRRDAREVAKQVAQEQLKPAEDRFEAQAKRRFFEQLSQHVPDWSEIDQSEEWKDWLGQYDVMRMATHNEMLQQAEADYNVDTVATLFNTFKRETQPVAQPLPHPTAAAPTPSVSSQVMPRPPANVPRTPEPTISAAEAANMLQDVVKGVYGPINGPRATEIRNRIKAAQEKGLVA